MNQEQIQAIVAKYDQPTEGIQIYLDRSAEAPTERIVLAAKVVKALVGRLSTSIEAFKAIPFIEIGDSEDLCKQYFDRMDEQVLYPLMADWATVTEDVREGESGFEFNKLESVSDDEFRLATKCFMSVYDRIHDNIETRAIFASLLNDPAWDLFVSKTQKFLERKLKALKAEEELLNLLVAERALH